MLSENIKNLRKEKGMSQEELASKLNVVRQTVSKWEQNLSVPDSEMLIKISEIFEVPVSSILGETVEIADTKSELEKISQKLENLNEMLAQRNSKNRRALLIIVAVCLIIISIIMLVFTAVFIARLVVALSPSNSVGIIGGADSPTAIFVASTSMDWLRVFIAVITSVILLTVAVIIIRKIKK